MTATATDPKAQSSSNDDVTKVKEEFTKKLGNVEDQMKALLDTNRQLADAMKKSTAPPPVKDPNEGKSWSDRWYEDADGTVKAIQEEAAKKALETVTRANQIEQEKAFAMNQLLQDYPELADEKDPLRAKAVDIYNRLSDQDKGSAHAYRIAVREAAADLGVLPKAKRKDSVSKDNDDDSEYTNRGGGQGTPKSRKKGGEAELTDEMLAFAELCGRPVDDEKYVARLKKAAGRKAWSRYGGK